MSHNYIMMTSSNGNIFHIVRGIHRSPVNSPHKGHWRRALMFSLICVWINGWVNNHEAGDLRHYRSHYDVSVMWDGYLVISVPAYVLALNTLRPRQNGRHFVDDTFRGIFLNENVRIFIKISLKFVPKGPINNNPALVQIMAPTRRQAIIWTNDG